VAAVEAGLPVSAADVLTAEPAEAIGALPYCTDPPSASHAATAVAANTTSPERAGPSARAPSPSARPGSGKLRLYVS
jgi:hypothetical protein